MSTSERSWSDAGSSGPFEACTADIESSTVTRCSRPPVRSFSLRPSAGRISAVRPWTTCERFSLVETCTVSSALRIACSVTSVSETAETKLPPIAKNTRARPSASALTASTVSKPCSRGGSKWNSSRSASRNAGFGRSQMPMVRSPCTLEWPRTGQSPAPGLPMLPWRNATLAISLMVATELRCWVSPIAQQITVRDGVAEHRRALLDLLAGQPGRGDDLVPVEVLHVRGVLLEAAGELLDEVVVDGVPLEQQRADGLEQREVAVDPDRQVQVGERGAAADHAARGLRVLEPHQPGLAQRVDRDDLRAVLLGDLERGEHPRVVGAGVLAGDHDQLGVVDVVEGDRALADADHLGQRHRGGLVAHVRAVGQVVGAERAGEQLVDERRLVGRLAGGVEDRLVRAGQPAQVLGDQLERVVPGDRLVVAGAGAQHHRLDDPALLAQPVVGLVAPARRAGARRRTRGRCGAGWPPR